MGGGGQAWQKDIGSAIWKAWDELETGLTSFFTTRHEEQHVGANASCADLVLLQMATINIFILHQHAISAATLHQHPESTGNN